MIFRELPLAGAYLIDVEPIRDERGFFARAWCQRELQVHGLESNIAQVSISFNEKAGTLRGMHYQRPPHEEAKLVRCTRGSIYDVIIDLRPESSTFKQHASVVLSDSNYKSLYIPKGFAHGFQTLGDNVEVLYQMSEFFVPDAATGVRWDDSAFGIGWPDTENRILSHKDRAWPDFNQ